MAWKVVIYNPTNGENKILPQRWNFWKDAFGHARRMGYAYESDPRIELYSKVVDDPEFEKRVDVLSMSDNLWYSIYVMDEKDILTSWKDWDYRYILDAANNSYVTFNKEYLQYLKNIGADDYDILIAQTHVDNCGRIICYAEKNAYGYYEPVDNEYLLNELYDQVDLLD